MYFKQYPYPSALTENIPLRDVICKSRLAVERVSRYTVNGHDLRFFENPHPSPLPKGEGVKAAIRARVKYSFI